MWQRKIKILGGGLPTHGPLRDIFLMLFFHVCRVILIEVRMFKEKRKKRIFYLAAKKERKQIYKNEVIIFGVFLLAIVLLFCFLFSLIWLVCFVCVCT